VFATRKTRGRRKEEEVQHKNPHERELVVSHLVGTRTLLKKQVWCESRMDGPDATGAALPSRTERRPKDVPMADDSAGSFKLAYVPLAARLS